MIVLAYLMCGFEFSSLLQIRTTQELHYMYRSVSQSGKKKVFFNLDKEQVFHFLMTYFHVMNFAKNLFYLVSLMNQITEIHNLMLIIIILFFTWQYVYASNGYKFKIILIILFFSYAVIVITHKVSLIIQKRVCKPNVYVLNAYI